MLLQKVAINITLSIKDMFNHHANQDPKTSVVTHWFLMCSNAGIINAGGFLATGRFVSHVTGFATLFGVDLAQSEIQAAIGILSVPVFFLSGAFIAGLLIDRPIYKKKNPHFDYVMGLSAICLFLAAVGDRLFSFGNFGEVIQLKQVYVLLSLLCLACGLQNAAITSSSGFSVRTTHLTGLTTDLGLGLARLFIYARKEPTFEKEMRASRLRSGSIAAFSVGSAIGAYFFIKFGYRAFILPGLIASYAAWHGRKAKLGAK